MPITVTLNCGHAKDYTGRADHLPNIGDVHPCHSSCDRVATWRGNDNPHIRRVAAITREG